MLNYNIRISGIKDGNHEYFFNINGKFFESFVKPEVTDSEIKVNCNLFKDGNKLKLSLNIEGNILNFNCDLCAGGIKLSIINSIDVFLQETESEMEDTDEIIYIQPNQSYLDISQLIYEAVILSIPSKIEHSGVGNDICDKEMMVLLDKYAKREEINDPRWDDLNKIKDLI
tara:strand:+ start:788 stop:1300 length:513 start_codon:yes stop_codon:yes gene_type:complete